MRIATLISTLFHVAVFLLAWLGLPRSHPEIVPVQVIEVEFESDTALLEPQPEPEPEKPAPAPAVKTPPPPPPAPERPQPVAKPEPEPVAKPELEPEPVPVPEPTPEPRAQPKPEPEPTPKPVQETVQAPKPKAKPKPPPPPKVAKAEPKKPEPKKQEPKKQEPQKPENDFASVLKTVKKLEKSAPRREPEPKPEKSLQQQVAEALSRNKSSRPQLDKAMSASDLDAIRRQIEACWNLPAGARDAHNMTVEIRTLMNPDGHVRSASIVDTARASHDSFYRSMAESALRAVLNPRCQPLRLPVEKYDEWRVLVLNFDPRGMF